MATMGDYVAEFAEKLLRFFPVYQGPRSGRGYRRLQFNGDVIERVADAGRMMSPIKAALPTDVAIIVFLGSVLRMHVCQDGAIRDAYDVFLASAEWQGPEEGGIIPQIQVPFENQRDDTGRVTGTIVKEVRDVTDFILLQDRIEKLHIEEGDVIVVGSKRIAMELAMAEPVPGQTANQIIVAPEGDITKLSRSEAVDALVALIDERVGGQNWLEPNALRGLSGDALKGRITGDYKIALTKIRSIASPDSELVSAIATAPCCSCSRMDWTEEGVDMTQEHHPRCKSFQKK